MRTLSHIYISNTELIHWIGNEGFKDSKSSLLVQINDSTLDKDSISEIIQVVKKEIPSATIVGSSSCGVIKEDKVYDYSTSITITEFESTTLQTFTCKDMDSYLAGQSMADSLIQDNTKCILLFIDNMYLNAGKFIKGFNNSNSSNVLLCGSGAGDNFLFEDPFVINDEEILSRGVVGVALNSDILECTTYVNNSWNSVGKYMMVTKAKDNVVYELDNQPVISVYAKYLGESVVSSIPESMIEFPLIYKDSGKDIIRSVRGIVDGCGLKFSANIREGTLVQFGVGNEQLSKNNIADIYLKASYSPVETIFVYSSASRKVFFDRDVNDEYKTLSTVATQSGFIGYGQYITNNGVHSFSNTLSVYLSLSESKSIKGKLDTTLVQPAHRRKSDYAVQHLIEITTQELVGELDDNNLLISTLEQYKYAMDKASLVSKTDLKGNITYANNRFCELSGYSESELIGNPHNMVRHPDMSPEIFKDLWETIKRKKIWSGMIKNRKKDGSSYHVHATIFPILDHHGNTMEYMSLREDLTSFIKYKNRLEREQDYLYQILDNQESIVSLCYEDSSVKYLNKRFFNYFDYKDLDDFKSKHISLTSLFVDENSKPIELEILRGEYELGLLKKTHMIDKFGNLLTFSVSTNMISMDDDIMFLTSLTDITQIEKSRILAEEAKNAKANFLANMSHEIRTPMNGIIGFTDLLSDSNLNDTQKKYLEIIKNSSSMLLDVVNGILDFSKIESQKLELDLVETNLYIELEQLYLTYTTLTKKKNILYRLEVDSKIEEYLYVDSLHLKQVLSNLINNAIKFTKDDGCVEVNISLVEDSSSSQKIRFSVKDSGIGITKERQKQIFSAFEQADSSTTREFGGTGLGLSISSSLVGLMGGSIDLDSSDGAGSEFYFVLNFEKCNNEHMKLMSMLSDSYVQVVPTHPKGDEVVKCLEKFGIKTHSIKDADTHIESRVVICFDESEAFALYNTLVDDNYFILCLDENSKSASPYENLKIISSFEHCSTEVYSYLYKHATLQVSMSNSNKFKDIEILVAEDNEVNQILIEEVLNKFDVKYKIVGNGKKAVVASKDKKYDLILMDVNMPVMNGIEATREILHSSLNIDTPIVAMTSNILEDDIIKYKELGMYSHVGKPFHTSDISNLLTTLFSKKISKRVEKSSVKKVDSNTIDSNIEKSLKDAGENLELPESIIEKLFIKFISTFDDILKEMDTYVQNSDYKNLLGHAHKLKGSSSSLCFERITDIAKDIESVSSDNVDYNLHVNELKKELEALKSYSKEHFGAK